MIGKSKLLWASILLLPSAAMAADAPKVDQVFVSVKSTALRSKPSALSSSVGTVSYGDGLSKISEEQGWLKVRTSGGREGYLHLSALSKKKIVLAGSAAAATAGENSEVVLANKGFNKEVEKQLRTKAGYNFPAVDKMENVKVSDRDVSSFLKEGGLKG